MAFVGKTTRRTAVVLSSMIQPLRAPGRCFATKYMTAEDRNCSDFHVLLSPKWILSLVRICITGILLSVVLFAPLVMYSVSSPAAPKALVPRRMPHSNTERAVSTKTTVRVGEEHVS